MKDSLMNDDPLHAHRGRLMGLAYRMLGSLSDAEDVLQDAYIRFASIETDHVKSEEAMLVTIVTRLCLDRLKSARAKREVYVGPWLPEPTPDADALSPQTALELADDLSFALLLTLERLTGPERAAFLLHDVFDTPFAEIAAALGKSEAACRQLAVRARKAVRSSQSKKPSSSDEHQKLLQRFMAAAASGEAGQLLTLFAEDAVAYTDGGGERTAAINPVYGAEKITRFFLGLYRKSLRRGEAVMPVVNHLNGRPSILFYIDGELDSTMSIDIVDGRIGTVYVVRSPSKLNALTSQLPN